MKKVLAGIGTLGVVLALMPVFAAFEAHVINVTARIENALSVPIESLNFGTVFPQEKFDKTFGVSLSGSFMDEPRVDDVEYLLRQKPKCELNTTGALVQPPLPQFGQVTEDGSGNFVCQDEVNYDLMPFLCPYLSKAEITADGTVQENDMIVPPETDGHSGPLASFHGPILLAPAPGGWGIDDTLHYQLFGRLAKSEQDTSDTWNIDFKVPCFGDHCAQDWADFVRANDGTNDANPNDYIQPIENEHKLFGCDLWLEVRDVSLSTSTASITVIKHVVNNDQGLLGASNFTMQVSGTNVSSTSFSGAESPGITVILDPGVYAVSELPVLGYTPSPSADCAGIIAAGQHKTCTITNDDNPIIIENGTITINKVLSPAQDPGKFDLQIDGSTAGTGGNVGNGGTTGAVVVSTGVHSVGEVAHGTTTLSDYTVVIGGDTDCADGSVSVPSAGSVTCTITNTRKMGTITVHKTVVNNDVGTSTASNFQITIDGNNVAQDTPIGVTTGVHTISEVDSHGYVKTVGVDCAANGTVTVGTGESKSCMVTNTFPFFTVTVNKVVKNDNGGNATTSDFSLFVGSTAVTSGVSKNVAVGTHLVSEGGVGGYAATFSGDCDSNTQLLTGASGDTKTCTITNDDIAPVITLIKHVVGGTASATDFTMRIDSGAPVPTGSSKTVTSNAGHTITEDAKTGYHFTSMAGVGSQGSTCPIALGGTVTLNEGEVITCTITNTVD